MSPPKQFDYVVVGSGSAGGMLSYRLSADPSTTVLLVEAGADKLHWSIRMPAATRNNFTGGPRNWCFETEPEPHLNHRKLFQPRGKVIGGSSSLNGMVFVRGHPKDYDSWECNGAKAWSYKHVLPYFKSMEHYALGESEYRGGSGPISIEPLSDLHPIEQAFLDAAQQCGYEHLADYNGIKQEGVTEFDVNVHNGQRAATALLLHSIKSRSNLQIRCNSQVTKILLNGTTAQGIEFLENNRVHHAYAKRETIISAGAFQSPQLLKLSGIGPAGQLQKFGIKPVVDLPGVGENLQDHLEVHVKHRCPQGLSKNFLLRKDRMLLAGVQWFLFKTGAAATTPSRVGGFLRTSDDVDYPNLQYHFWPYYLEGWSPPPHQDGYCFDVGPVRPYSRGWVKLRSANPLDPPTILLNALSHEQDRKDFRRCIEITREIASQSAFDFCRGPEISPGPDITNNQDIDKYIRENANSAYHPCGTCKIGQDSMAVVDHLLRVHSVNRLRVVDASVMPTIPNGNINAPCLMIGERAADMLLNDSGSN